MREIIAVFGSVLVSLLLVAGQSSGGHYGPTLPPAVPLSPHPENRTLSVPVGEILNVTKELEFMEQLHFDYFRSNGSFKVNTAPGQTCVGVVLPSCFTNGLRPYIILFDNDVRNAAGYISINGEKPLEGSFGEIKPVEVGNLQVSENLTFDETQTFDVPFMVADNNSPACFKIQMVTNKFQILGIMPDHPVTFSFGSVAMKQVDLILQPQCTAGQQAKKMALLLTLVPMLWVTSFEEF